VDLFEHDCKDGVGTGGRVVHFGGGCGSVAVAEAHVAKEFGVVLDRHVGEVFDVGAFGGGFADLEVVGVAGRGGSWSDEEISDVLVVDFEVGDSDGVGDVGRYAGFDTLKEVFAGTRDQTRLLVGAHHCVRFA